MIKTVKVKKKLRLDELIKYVWDNGVQNERFQSNESDILVLVEHGRVFTEWTIDKCETFTVEEEEEITEDTVFDSLIEITVDGGYIDHGYNVSIPDVKSRESLRFYALIDKKLELVGEAE